MNVIFILFKTNINIVVINMVNEYKYRLFMMKHYLLFNYLFIEYMFYILLFFYLIYLFILIVSGPVCVISSQYDPTSKRHSDWLRHHVIITQPVNATLIGRGNKHSARTAEASGCSALFSFHQIKAIQNHRFLLS